MHTQSKRIAMVVGSALITLGLVIVGGKTVVQGRQVPRLTYQPPSVADSDPTVFPTVIGKPTVGLDLKQLFTVTPQALAQGKQLFNTDCTVCHGAVGKGDGAAAVALTPRPRNLTVPQGWTVGYTIADIYTTLTDGIKGTGMASFEALSPADRFAVAHYVQSLGRFDHHDNVAAEIAKVDAKYHLSEGPRGPNKVAVPTIMTRMAAEYAAPAPIAQPAAADSSAAAMLRRRLVGNAQRAAAVLSQVPDWRTSVDDFARAAMASPPDNGFDPAVAALDAAQWRAFHREIVALTPVRAPDAPDAVTTSEGKAP